MAELPVVDKEERERIRNGLKRYKELHGGIGDPELHQRIMYAVGLSDAQVPLSTLQRFIRGTHRTDDIMVRRYQKFLSKVAPPPASDELGSALAKFLSPIWQDREWASAFAGEYRTFVQARGTPEGEPAKFTVGCSKVRLAPSTDTSFLRATEFMFDPERQDGKEPDASWLGNTGVFAPIGGSQYFMIVRSLVETRIYLLRKVLDAPLSLHGHALQPDGAFPLVAAWPGKKRKPVTEFIMTALKDRTEVPDQGA